MNVQLDKEKCEEHTGDKEQKVADIERTERGFLFANGSRTAGVQV